METAYFISVGFYWFTAFICSQVIKAEANKILDYYSIRWNMDIRALNYPNLKPGSKTVTSIISSLIPGWNVLNAIFMIVGVAPMKANMWKVMQDADVSHYY
jgi:hypothetical protein